MRSIKTLKMAIKKIVRKKTELEILVERGLKIGNNFRMQQGCIIDDSHCWHIEIGDDVTLAPRVHILAHDASTKMHLGYTKIKNVWIGNQVFVGAGSIILPGAKIGNNVIIGAGSVIVGEIPEDTVYAGVPAKFICHTSDYIEKQRKQMNARNCFDESFTLRIGLSDEKKRMMKEIVDTDGIGFVV